jgi:hypothetical protein
VDPKEKLAALATEAQTLAAKAQTADFTEADAERAEAISKEHGEISAAIARQAKAAKALAGISAPIADSRDEAPEVQRSAQTLGEAFVSSPAMKAFRDEHATGVSEGTPIKVKAKCIGSRGRSVAKADPAPLTTGGAGNAAPVRLPGIDDLVYRPPRALLDLITRGTTDLPWVQYRQLVTKTNNAAIVAEATTTTGTTPATGLKPLSTLTTKTADAIAYTYADGIEATNQELTDDGLLTALIDSFLTENLDILTEYVLLNGDGLNGVPKGLLNTTGVLQQDFSVDAQQTLRKAMTALQTRSAANIQAIVLHPEDDESWDLLKGTDGHYLGAGPYATGLHSAWGIERVASQAVTPGTALIGDFRTIQLLDLEATSVEAFNQHKDYAQHNLVYVRAEKRSMQLFRAPAKLCVVDIKGA